MSQNIKCLDPEEEETLLNVLGKRKDAERAHMLYRLMLVTGLRLSEALWLNVEDASRTKVEVQVKGWTRAGEKLARFKTVFPQGPAGAPYAVSSVQTPARRKPGAGRAAVRFQRERPAQLPADAKGFQEVAQRSRDRGRVHATRAQAHRRDETVEKNRQRQARAALPGPLGRGDDATVLRGRLP